MILLPHDHDDNGPMSEPYAREHVEKSHGWSRFESLFPAYFVVLWRHLREHRRALVRVVR